MLCLPRRDVNRMTGETKPCPIPPDCTTGDNGARLPLRHTALQDPSINGFFLRPQTGEPTSIWRVSTWNTYRTWRCSPAWPSPSPCSVSTYSATACVIFLIHAWWTSKRRARLRTWLDELGEILARHPFATIRSARGSSAATGSRMLPAASGSRVRRSDLEQRHLFLSRCRPQPLIEEGPQVVKILLHRVAETLLV